MAATMNKADVYYGGGVKITPDKVKWPDVVSSLVEGIHLSGVNDAKKALADAAAHPKMCKAYVKVGLLKDDLYLRIKLEGGVFKSTVREDTLLVKGYRKLVAAREQWSADGQAKVRDDANKAHDARVVADNPGRAANAGKSDSDIANAKFDTLLNTSVKEPLKAFFNDVKSIGSLITGDLMADDDLDEVKTALSDVGHVIDLAEEGLEKLDALVRANPGVLGPRAQEIAQYRKTDALRDTVKNLQTRYDAIVAKRGGRTVIDQCRTKLKEAQTLQGALDKLVESAVFQTTREKLASVNTIIQKFLISIEKFDPYAQADGDAVKEAMQTYGDADKQHLAGLIGQIKTEQQDMYKKLRDTRTTVLKVWQERDLLSDNIGAGVSLDSLKNLQV